MALDQLKAFLVLMQNDPALKDAVLASATADDVARLAAGLGYVAGLFSGQAISSLLKLAFLVAASLWALKYFKVIKKYFTL